MRRSYFSRVSRGYDGAALRPPRPVASLWKAARLDWLASASPRGPGHSTVPRLPYRDTAASRNLVTGAAQSAVDSAPERDLAPNFEPPRERSGPRPGEVVSEIARPPSQAAANRAQPEAPPAARSASSTKPFAAVRSHRDRSREGQQSETRLPLPVTRPADIVARREAVPAQASTPAGSKGAAAVDRPYSPVSLPALEPAGPEHRPPRWTRETIADPEAQPQSRSAAPERNKVEIGKLEVQVIAPPAMPHTPRAPLAQSRLARGYALWPGC